MTHTPGIWKCLNPEDDKDGRVLAAGPELLDACKRAYRVTYKPSDPELMAVHRKLAEAIVKAEGIGGVDED